MYSPGKSYCEHLAEKEKAMDMRDTHGLYNILLKKSKQRHRARQSYPQLFQAAGLFSHPAIILLHLSSKTGTTCLVTSMNEGSILYCILLTNVCTRLVSRDILREAVFLGIIPFPAVLSMTLIAVFRASCAFSTDLSSMACRRSLTTVFSLVLQERFRKRRT
jgi:hypothetical protein